MGFATTPDGDKFTINWTFITPPFGEGIFRRLDVAGQEVWSVDLAGPPVSIAASPDKTACVIFERTSMFALETRMALRCIAPGEPTGSDREVDLPGFSIFGFGQGIGTGVAIDQTRDRIYVFVPSIDFQTFEYRILTIAYDRSLNLIAQRPHVFPIDGGVQQITSLSVDGNGNVWTSGVEVFGYPQPSRVFIARHPPNLTATPVIIRRSLADYSITLKASGDPRGGVVITGDRDAFGNSDTFQRISANELGNLVFGDVFRIPGYTFEPFAVDGAGSIYAPGYIPETGTRSITKRGPTNLASWSPEYLSLPAGRHPQFIKAPITDTFDLAGYVAGGAPTTFLSRYAAGGAFNRIRAITPSDRFEPVGVPMLDKLVYTVLDNLDAPQSDVEVSYSIAQTNPPAGRSSAVFYSSETKTDSDGLARAGLKLGFLPVEYTVSANCPSCLPTLQTAEIQVCGKIETRMFRNNVDSPLPGELPWAATQLDHHYMFLLTAGISGNIRMKGCALTATTMLLNIFKHRYNLSYVDSTPRTLNDFWSVFDSAQYGFSAGVPNTLVGAVQTWKREIDGGLYFPNAIPRFTNREVRYLEGPVVGPDNLTVDEAMALVNAHLDVGDPALLHIESSTDAGHFMTIVGRCGRKYFVLDPNINTNHTVIDLDNLTVTIKGVRLFEKG